MNKTSGVFAYITQHISTIIFATSLLFLAVSVYVVFQPHFTHKLFSFFNAGSSSEVMYYDPTASPTPIVSSTPSTIPDTGGCGCPGCCKL